ncbi:hypothetical protein D8O01_19745, partial [Acinetobacter baumannii]
ARLEWQNENRLREAERRSYHYCSQGKSKKQARNAAERSGTHLRRPVPHATEPVRKPRAPGMAERKPPARSGTAQLPLLQPGQEQEAGAQ